jgi:nitronate monooxygenase
MRPDAARLRANGRGWLSTHVETAFTRLVGCTHPLQQAAMGGVAVPELAGAVAGAGALGMLCEFDIAPPLDRIERALSLAMGGSVGMGFFGHWMGDDLATFEQAAHVLRVVEVFWTTPDKSLVDRARRSGDARVAWQVGSAADALAAQDAGCDFVVAQGTEAGGHVRGTTTRDVLLGEILTSVSIPVVVAGGIANAADVARAIAAGAAAVRVGTAFVATEESGGHPAYINALLAARSGTDTVLTTAFGEGWPDAPHRVLSSALAAAEAFDGDVVGEAGAPDARYPVPRFGVATPNRHVTGHVEAMALYAGTGVGDLHTIRPAADLVAELVSQLS